MKTKRIALAILALILSPSFALAKPVQSNGTREHSNQPHDRTPRLHDRCAVTH